MPYISSIVSIAAIICVGIASGADADPPVFMPLGTLEGPAGTSNAGGMSRDGRIVVGGSSVGTERHGFVWTLESEMTDTGLGDLGENGTVRGLSEDGRTLLVLKSDPTIGARTFRAAGGLLEEIPPIAGLTNFQVTGIELSKDGSVMTGFQSGIPNGKGPGRLMVFRWTAATGSKVLTGLEPEQFVFSQGFGMSPSGSFIIGSAQTGPDDDALPFRWSEQSGVQWLAVPPGFEGAAVTDINDDGIFASGTAFREVGENTYEYEYTALRYVGNRVEILGDLPGGPLGGIASAISEDGRVVVGRGNIGMNGDPRDGRAFIWDGIHGVRDLHDVLVELGAGPVLDGWTLRSAQWISADGRVIAGTGLNPAGRDEAYVAIVPEPTTPLLLLFGTAALVRRNRRPHVFMCSDEV